MTTELAVSQKPVDGIVEYTPRRIESASIDKATGEAYRHYFFTDVSGKDAIFEKVDFSYAVFVRGYFHKAEFRNCKFTGARFSDCNFRNATFSGCDFRYADFTGARIPTDEILKNVPDEPNIRRELLQIMRKNSLSLGDVISARKFVLAEISAKKEHLRRAWRQEGSYYKLKYSGFRKRALIGIERVGLWLDSFLWGHGERLWKMAISVGVLLAGSAAVSAVSWASGQVDPTVSSISRAFGDALSYYTSLFLDVQTEKIIHRIIWLDWTIVVSRYLAFGVLVSGLFRWLSHR